MQPIEPREFVENRTFHEIEIGDTASLSRTMTQDDLLRFAAMAGERVPAHGDEVPPLARGMWIVSLTASLLGTTLPGPGTVPVSHTLGYLGPVSVGDTVTIEIRAIRKDPARRCVSFSCRGVSRRGTLVLDGTVDILAPEEKIRRPREEVPEPHVHEHGRLFRDLHARTRGLDPIRVAVVHPVDSNALLGSVEAARADLVVPVLIGPEDRIRAVAEEEEVDISPFTLIPTEHSHAAAETAVAMARAGQVDALMKGSLHTDELMHSAVAPGSGLATDRRMSHVFVMDVPTYPRPLFVTDAALNVAPDLEDKRDIVQNAIELVLALGGNTPKIAVLSAVETVNPRLQSTLDAAALAKMADRGQIVGGVVDGPLAFDNAISADAARVKGIVSPVAGQPDILLVPDLEAGNILVKQLTYLADSQALGIVLGGRVPIVLTSRADTPEEHALSCALALLLVRRSTKHKVKL